MPDRGFSFSKISPTDIESHNRRHTKVKLPPILAVILAVVLAAAEAIQLNISMSIQVHDAITVIITVISGLGILAITPTQLAVLVPHEVLVGITALLGALNVIQVSSFDLSTTWHTIIAVVLVIGNALFTSTGPTPAPVPAPPA
jgi:hypothetical protein